MRLIVGYTFIDHRLGQLTNLAQVTENFIGWGIPFQKSSPLRVGASECFGGVMLILACSPGSRRRCWDVNAGRHQVGEWERCRFAGDLLGFEEMTYFAAFMWPCDRRSRRCSVDRLLVNAARHPRRIDLRIAFSALSHAVTPRKPEPGISSPRVLSRHQHLGAA